MTVDTRGLAWQIVAYDARLKLAVERNEMEQVELLHEMREDAATERYKAMRANWVRADRPRFPEAA